MVNKDNFDLVVIGGGALGSFHALQALEKGLKVALIEKDRAPQEATTRNFGQIVPSGMNAKWQAIGRESLCIYKQLQSTFDISVKQEGTVYLASNEEEVQLIEELHLINKGNGYPSRLLEKAECLKKYPGLRSDYVKAGLYFEEEITIEPRKMIHSLLEYMVKEKGLIYMPSTLAIACEPNGTKVRTSTASGISLDSQKAIICNGRDFKALFPDRFANSDLELSKLQMMQTKPQGRSYRLKGSVLTGLSIRRYEAFHECPSYQKVKSAEATDSPVKKWGIHILFKQAMDGSVILGDSHEYANVKEMDQLGFDLNMDIDDFILKSAQEIINLPTYEISHRWFGVYSQSKTKDLFQETVEGNIHIVTGIGGKGMTGSPGFAKENINRIYNR